MDWEKVLLNWGPMAIAVIALWKLHTDVVNKAIPDGFKMIARAMRNMNARSDRRFRLQFKRLVAVEKLLVRCVGQADKPPAAKPRRRRRKPRQKKTAAK